MKYTHKLSKPYSYMGTDYTEIEFDFGKLTGRDLIDAETEIVAEGGMVWQAELSANITGKLAARAAEKSSGFIENLPLTDFNAVIGRVKSFLLGTDTEK